MSGHNKWSKIKHKKGKEDAKRGKIFTRIIRDIMISSREGGGDPSGNAALATALVGAKAANMPKETIDRAIKRGTGEIEGESYEEYTYEGYGPGGVAIMVDAMTDNRNRTASDVRHVFSKYGGNMGESGCVSYLFERKGVITLSKEQLDEEALMELLLEIEADDYIDAGEDWEVRVGSTQINQARQLLETKGLTVASANVAALPMTSILVEGRQAETLMKLLQALEDLDDVQEIYANYDMDEALFERLNS